VPTHAWSSRGRRIREPPPRRRRGPQPMPHRIVRHLSRTPPPPHKRPPGGTCGTQVAPRNDRDRPTGSRSTPPAATCTPPKPAPAQRSGGSSSPTRRTSDPRIAGSPAARAALRRDCGRRCRPAPRRRQRRRPDLARRHRRDNLRNRARPQIPQRRCAQPRPRRLQRRQPQRLHQRRHRRPAQRGALSQPRKPLLGARAELAQGSSAGTTGEVHVLGA
jgi:hypothetical protein